jgi:phage regulator Rha-like protein
MQDIMSSNQSQTMSLKDITDLLETRHNNAMKVVEKMAKSPEFGELLKISSSYKNNLGAELPIETYALNKRQSVAVAAKLNTTLLMRVIDRWQELESQLPKSPTTYIEALQALIESEIAKQKALDEVSKLNTIIDNEFGYSSILRAAVYAGVHESTFDWRVLKGFTLGIGMEVKRVPSPRYGYQNLYPIKAFQECYRDIDFDDLKPELVDDKARLAITH